MNFDATTGLELIGREVIMILIDQLDDEISSQEAIWDIRDQELATAQGRNWEPVRMERIPPERMYLGHVPSLITADINLYPNISVMPFISRPGGDQSIDLYHGNVATVFIEILAKAGPYPANDESPAVGEDLVNRRTQRITDAVVAVLNRNPTLNGLVARIPTPPSVEISDVFGKHQERDRGPRYWWQGSRIEHRVERLQATF